MATVIAHLSGHWSTWVVYLGPIVGVGGWLAVESLRERRRGDQQERPRAPEPTA